MRSNATRRIVNGIIAVATWFVLGAAAATHAQDVAVPATPVVAPASPAPYTAVTPPASGVAKPTPAPKPPVIPYEQQVYQVSITLGVAPELDLSNGESQRIVDQLRALVETRIGMWWQSRVTLSPAGEPNSRAMLELRTAKSWNEALEPTTIEKKFALTLDREGTEFRLSGVEWDRASQTVTSIQGRTTFDRRLLPTLAADLVFDLFRPLVTIDTVVENRVEMRIRGGEYLPPDPLLTPFAVGDYVTCFMRHLGKNRELKRMQYIPWTSVRIELIERGYLRGTTVSAFGSPLAGSRRRVELLGLKIRPAHPQTRLQVIPRGKPQSPMAGYRVELLDRPETKDDKVEDRVNVRTDRNGEIVIPADPAKPLRYVIVYSGAAPLAKAPLIPGEIERLVLEAPDDSARLNVEAETELLQSELVDIVARREVLMARARGASKKANWDMVTDLEKQVDTLPTLDMFATRIEALKTPAVQSAKRNKDKAQESRIIRMCKQISDMAILHLDPIKVKEFHTEIEEEKKSQ